MSGPSEPGMMSMPVRGAVRHGCAVVGDLDRRQRCGLTGGHHRLHRIIGRANAAHRRMLRPGLMPCVRAPGVDSDAGVSAHVEPKDAMQTVRTIRIGTMHVRCVSVLELIGPVCDMRQSRVAVDVIVCGPRPDIVPIVVTQRELMRGTVENDRGHVSTGG